MKYVTCHEVRLPAVLLAVLTAVCLAAAPASATPLYEQTPNAGFSDSYEDPLLGANYYADAFNFGGGLDRIVTSVEWWGIETALDPLSYNIRFFESVANQPGAVIASFSGTPVQPSTNAEFGLNIADLRLSGNADYFISISADTDLLAQESFQWSHGGANGSGGSWLWIEPLPGLGSWTNDGTPENFAFRLNGHVVPEPATILLLGAGMGGLAWRRLRGRVRA